MSIDLTGHVIVITGASSGIGAALAVEAAGAGMNVVLAARRADRLDQVAEQVRRTGAEALVVPTDVSRDDDVARLVERTVEHFGRLDVMCANAGYGFRAAVADLDPDMHRAVFETNYFGTVRCVQQAIPVMKRQQSGHIMIVSSIVGRIGLPMYAAYSATKAAQAAFAMALRVELERYGIHADTVYEQIDALEMLAIDPMRHLAMPRFVATFMMMPVITIFADAIARTGYRLLIVAPNVLGTINATLLTIEAARARRIPLAGVVLNGTPEIDLGNGDAISHFSDTEILGEMPTARSLDDETLADLAEAHLDLDHLLGK